MFWKHFKDMFSQRCFQCDMNDFQENVFKTIIMRCFENIFLEIIHSALKTSLWKHVFKMLSKQLFNVEKTSHDNCLENVFLKIIQNALKTSLWKHLFKMLSKMIFQKILKIFDDQIKMSLNIYKLFFTKT